MTSTHPSRRLLGRLGLAVLVLALAPAVVLAAYPPGAYPGSGPTGAFPTVVVSQTVGTAGGTLAASSGSATLTLSVPSGAFPQDTQVTIYGGASSVLSALLPSGATLLDGYAVGWTPPTPASIPLTLTIVDPRIGAGDLVFETMGSGLMQAPGALVQAGEARVGMTTDPGVVVAVPATPPAPSASPGATTSPATALPPTTLARPGGTTGTGPAGMLSLLFGAAALGAALGGWILPRRRLLTTRR